MRKQLFRHWKRETLEQVQIQGQQLEELQQAVISLQTAVRKLTEQQNEKQSATEKTIRDSFESFREWQEQKTDAAFEANRQWQEALLKNEKENQRSWEEEKIDTAFEANRQWQEMLIKAEGEHHRKWEEERLDSAFTANQQWQEKAIENLQGWIQEHSDGIRKQRQHDDGRTPVIHPDKDE